MSTISFVSNLEQTLEKTNTHVNLSAAELTEKAIERGEGYLTSTGALRVVTGKYTGRSPKDKYIVNERSSSSAIHWGTVNQPIGEERFKRLYEKVLNYLGKQDCFVFAGYAGADPDYRMAVRVVTEYAWHNLFARQLFIRSDGEEPANYHADFTVISAPGFHADPEIDGTKSETFIIISFEHRIVLIGGTEYAGEIKKSIFSVMNYLLPEKNVMPMHCSANVGSEGDVALFFGLSGTGKTTLSADPHRKLIGDDEHGWSDNGVFNIEGGCYAKCINLSQAKEPQIWNAIRFGAVVENVIVDEDTRVVDYADTRLTENTRAAYPIESIDNIVLPSMAGHPNTIVFLTADAFGVLPPISKLTREQAMYHFISGYTSKLAGTERGITSPQATFSTCFAEPFLPLRPQQYAEMLGDKIERHQTEVYLVNTGWTGGPYGTGKRINLSHTRAMIRAALEGELSNAETVTDPIFGLNVPVACPGVPDAVLQPKKTWSDPDAYDEKARALADQFKENFKKFEAMPETVKNGGPN
ncbi:MAG TPA: phosphoenolpyruvate carboxykinase (ATP) [Bacillales bacterium]|nr:phosphoenolpyruvate carboxykinase (ATP) [Bacillales bacterium]